MSKVPAIDTTCDPAVKFTLAYLGIIERALGITYTSQGEPVCLPQKITIGALASLAFDLDQLLKSDEARAAIDACKQFGQEHIQSIGFGHVSDFDAFVKVGFLYSERVVLWDILSSRVITPGSVKESSKGVIADLACNLLLLRPTVEKGGCVVLPHPLAWSQAAREIAKELAKAGSKSTSALGLSMALIAVDEGIPLHPFTLVTSLGSRRPLFFGSDKDQAYTEENHNFATAATAVMGAPAFNFLRDIRIDRFYEVTLAHPDLHRFLRKLFSSLNGMTPQQTRKEMEGIYAELRKLATTRDTAIANYKVEGAVATAGLVASAATMLTSPGGATVMAILGIAPTAIAVTRRWLAHPQRNVIVQAFFDLHAACPFTVEFPTEIPLIEDATPVADADLLRHIEAVTDAHWTEDAHQYLEELPEDTAIRVLEALRPEQMFSLVNYRRRQEDYIGDYLTYVWKASPDAFWRHIEQMLMSEDGLLMCDRTDIDDVLTSEDMPIAVWMTFLQFIPSVYKEILTTGTPQRYKEEGGPQLAGYQVEQLVKVMSYQLLESESMAAKQVVFCLWLSNLAEAPRSTVEFLLPKLFPEGLPKWWPCIY